MFPSFISILHILIVLCITCSYDNFKNKLSLALCIFPKKINVKGTSQRVGFIAGQASANYR
ncbi:hypothetical protein GCM10023261_11220 [Bartonella jaculi]|uniref:Uncharacterized protein n=1 Tax=Bartonella jaculi TaxID=686226 RepID=A0ABP9N5G6_9HYPH